jgi:hypothetical protein
MGHNRAALMHGHFSDMEKVINDSSERADRRFGDKVDVLWSVVDRLARFFADIVIKVKPSSVAKGRHPELWPTTPKDLIPYGVKSRNPDAAGI